MVLFRVHGEGTDARHQVRLVGTEHVLVADAHVRRLRVVEAVIHARRVHRRLHADAARGVRAIGRVAGNGLRLRDVQTLVAVLGEVLEAVRLAVAAARGVVPLPRRADAIARGVADGSRVARRFALEAHRRVPVERRDLGFTRVGGGAQVETLLRLTLRDPLGEVYRDGVQDVELDVALPPETSLPPPPRKRRIRSRRVAARVRAFNGFVVHVGLIRGGEVQRHDGDLDRAARRVVDQLLHAIAVRR
mmetsp:Transcript_13490/g.57548  ORF Transcript_13490/g.57548 Transcript_13490/m.57548 type:complete len:247 (-) Transcript_13490:405-1145(-)